MTTGLDARRAQKASGVHYTPPVLAEFVARKLAEACQVTNPSILDPAIGDGELLLALIRALDTHGKYASAIVGYDTDPAAIEAANHRIATAASASAPTIVSMDFLQVALRGAQASDEDLFAPGDVPLFDLIIANPPYVRTQVLGSEEAQRIAAVFRLSGRVDLYFAFLIGIAHVLKPGGLAGVIVSNRFMTTRAGAVVRRSLRQMFEIVHVWDLGDTRLFEAAVLPAVLLLRRRSDSLVPDRAGFTAIYSAPELEATVSCADPLAALLHTGPVRLPQGTYEVRHGELYMSQAAHAVWRLSSGETDTWLATVEAHTHCSFGDIGRIRVGVKTTADRIFIRSDWLEFSEEGRPELLRPLTTHHAGRRYRALPPIYSILYPHEKVQGKRRAVDLSSYPRTASYLSQHRAVLESRQYVVEAGRQWYEIWVPQDPDLWALPKLVFRDISERPTFWVDLDGTVVNGDCYWMVPRQGQEEDLLWLALAVANSSFIEVFYDRRFNNKLYAGRRRFMTQYVEQFPIPTPNTEVVRQIVASTKRIWQTGMDHGEEADLDGLVWSAFGLTAEKRCRQGNL
jgi:adenine-specific DNA-methyltransferase